MLHTEMLTNITWCDSRTLVHAVNVPKMTAPLPIARLAAMATLQTPDLSPEAIFAALSGLKVGGSDPFVDGEFQGGECRIFKISFKDQSSLSVRVYHPLWKDQQSILGNVHSEMEIFRKLESSGFRWVPRFRAASLTFDNPMLYPFMVLDWVDGATLQWKDDVPSRLIRDKVLAQLAEIQLSLISCTMEERMPKFLTATVH